MANLIPRFYDVTSGSITIDGIDVRDVTARSLRAQIGTVLQDSFLFSDTVMNNIRYGRPGATDAEVIAAARLARADTFVERLPDGYQTVLGERGSGLSLGQRQLLAIARAALADPRILILDEATSSVDTRTERLIQTALEELLRGRTSFVIAHRLSTIRHADQVIALKDGQIIERGTHDELLAARGFYYDLYMSQFRRDLEFTEADPARSRSSAVAHDIFALKRRRSCSARSASTTPGSISSSRSSRRRRTAPDGRGVRGELVRGPHHVSRVQRRPHGCQGVRHLVGEPGRGDPRVAHDR